MKDEMYIGSAPCDERGAQLGCDNYVERSNVEMRAFIHQLRRVFGEEPDGARLHIVWSPHDFGTYGSVSCAFNSEDGNASRYALTCEDETPERWDEDATIELSDGGYPIIEESDEDE